MRLAVLVDVHGNLPALEAVLEDVQRHGVDGSAPEDWDEPAAAITRRRA
jgi:hypothetical protein